MVINLAYASGEIIATTTTDSNDDYQFTGLCAGTYAVEFVTPEGYGPVGQCSDDPNTSNDRNCSPATVVLPTDSSSNQTIDFGFLVPM